MLAAQFRDRGSTLGLLEDGNDLAIGKTGRLHAEFPKNLSLKNSTFKRDHLLGGLPRDLLYQGAGRSGLRKRTP